MRSRHPLHSVLSSHTLQHLKGTSQAQDQGHQACKRQRLESRCAGRSSGAPLRMKLCTTKVLSSLYPPSGTSCQCDAFWHTTPTGILFGTTRHDHSTTAYDRMRQCMGSGHIGARRTPSASRGNLGCKRPVGFLKGSFLAGLPCCTWYRLWVCLSPFCCCRRSTCEPRGGLVLTGCSLSYASGCGSWHFHETLVRWRRKLPLYVTVHKHGAQRALREPLAMTGVL